MKEGTPYKNPPVTNVICQFKFPTILKINSEAPVNFQEKVRKEYPNYSLVKEITNIPDGSTPSIISINENNHNFSSDENDWRINLTQSFVALTTTKYVSWSQFSERLFRIIEALDASYDISSYTRIGLRYTNVIERSKYGLNKVPWNMLIEPYFLGMLGNELTDQMGYSNACEMKFNQSLDRARIMTLTVTNNMDPRPVEERERYALC